MKRGTAAKVILGKDTLMDVPAGIVHGTDVILGGKAGLLNDFGGLVLSNNLMIGKKVSRGTITTVTVRGQSPLVLPDAIAGSLQAVKAFGGTEQRDIPDNYLQRQYIYMLDGSYLLTDLVPTYDCKIEMDFQTTTTAGSPVTYLGARTSSTDGDGLRLGHITNKKFRIYGFGGSQDSTDAATNNTRYKYVWDNQRATITSGGTTVLDKTFTDTGTTTDYLAINAWNTNGSIAGNVEGIYLYSFKMWDNQGELIADYVPAVEKGTVPVVGFYDMVSKSFKTATSGTFAAGTEATPTPDAPMDIVCNNGVLKYGPLTKNLFDPTRVQFGYYLNATTGEKESNANNWCSDDDYFIPCQPNTDYTFYGISEGTYSRANSIYFFDGSKNYIGRVSNSIDYRPATGSTPNNCYYLKVRSNPLSTTVTQERYDSFNWQLEQSSTATDYVAYQEGIYADGTVETIGVHSKNLFDPTIASYESFGVTGPSANIRYGHIYRNGTYTIKQNVSGTQIYVKLVSGGSYGTALQITTARTLTVSGDDMILVYAGSTTPKDVTDYEVQVERGTSDTEYQPYFDGGTATAEMLLAIGNDKDQQEIIGGAVTRNIGYKVFDGTETFGSSSAYGQALYINRSYAAAWGADSSKAVLCTHFLGKPMASSQQDLYTCFFNASGHFYFRTEETEANFKTWLAQQYAAGTPVIVYFVKSDATTESVAGQALTAGKGDNIAEITQASLTGLELEATYKSLVQLTIQEVEDANLNNNVEVTIS